MTSSNCLVIYGYLPKHEEAGSHALSAWNGVLFLRGRTHELEEVLGDPEVLSVIGLLPSDRMHHP
jgi:hypothetical protein